MISVVPLYFGSACIPVIANVAVCSAGDVSFGWLPPDKDLVSARPHCTNAIGRHGTQITRIQGKPHMPNFSGLEGTRWKPLRECRGASEPCGGVT